MAIGRDSSERMAGWFSSAIINVSDANRELALRHGISDPKRMLTIWNGIPDTPHRARPGVSAVPRIVMVARCAEQKDHSVLLRAFARIAEPAQLIFVGDGPKLAPLRAEANELNVTNRVEFLGDRFDIAEILSGSHIFALASKWEGFPLSILEAMRAGLPVVASNVGGVSEAVTDGKTGFLVERGDVSAFRNRLHSLLDNPALRRTMGAAGRQRYEAAFTLDHMLRKTLAVYQMAVLGVRAAGALAFPMTPASEYARRLSIDTLMATSVIQRIHPVTVRPRGFTYMALCLMAADISTLFVSVATSLISKTVVSGVQTWEPYLRLWPFLFVFLAVYALAGLYSGLALSPPEEVEAGNTLLGDRVRGTGSRHSLTSRREQIFHVGDVSSDCAERNPAASFSSDRSQ